MMETKDDIAHTSINTKEDADIGEFMYCLCAGTYSDEKSNSVPLVCKTCDKLSHRECTFYSGPGEEFECMLCRVQLLDPFNSVVDFLWYGLMGNRTAIFEVDTTNLKKWRSQNKDIYVVSIPLTSEKLHHEWPKSFELRVNNDVLHVVKDPSWEHKRRDNPIRITYAMRPGENLVEMFSTTYGENGPIYLVLMLVSKQVTVERMIETIQKKRTLPYEEAYQRVIEILNRETDDDEVVCLETNHRIELNCPVTMDRIELPTRGKYCRHLQCYDLNGYLQVMQKTATFNMRWKCPECHLIVKPFDLVIDGFVQRILEDMPRSIVTVELDKNGNYFGISLDQLGHDFKKSQESFNNSSGSVDNQDIMLTKIEKRSSEPGYYTFVSAERPKARLTDDKLHLDKAKRAAIDGKGCHVKTESVSSDPRFSGTVIYLDSDEEACKNKANIHNRAPLGFKKNEVICISDTELDSGIKDAPDDVKESKSHLEDKFPDKKCQEDAKNTFQRQNPLSQRLSQLPKMAGSTVRGPGRLPPKKLFRITTKTAANMGNSVSKAYEDRLNSKTASPVSSTKRLCATSQLSRNEESPSKPAQVATPLMGSQHSLPVSSEVVSPFLDETYIATPEKRHSESPNVNAAAIGLERSKSFTVSPKQLTTSKRVQ